jgi:uncharacterized protein (DUF362 family)
MLPRSTRREFLVRASATAAGLAFGRMATALADEPRGGDAKSRVVIARDEALQGGAPREHAELVRKLLDASMQKLTQTPDAAAAWRAYFGPKDYVGIKVNTLGLSTQPAVVDAIVAGLRVAGVPAENIVIWDRLDVELTASGFKLNKSRSGVQCRGTDAEQMGAGYQSQVESSGQIGSCFSQIIAEQVTVLISAPVLKDHDLAGASLGMKNFYGAIHNPNKYHANNCDPYVADVVAHRFIRPKWRLTVCDGTRAQYHGGPARHPAYTWPFAGLIVSDDFVAADAVAADLIDAQRKAHGLPTLAEAGRPVRHILTAGSRGLGQADLSRIERIEA